MVGSIASHGDGAPGRLDGDGTAARGDVCDHDGLAGTDAHFDQGEHGLCVFDVFEDASVEGGEVREAAEGHGGGGGGASEVDAVEEDGEEAELVLFADGEGRIAGFVGGKGELEDVLSVGEVDEIDAQFVGGAGAVPPHVRLEVEAPVGVELQGVAGSVFEDHFALEVAGFEVHRAVPTATDEGGLEARDEEPTGAEGPFSAGQEVRGVAAVEVGVAQDAVASGVLRVEQGSGEEEEPTVAEGAGEGGLKKNIFSFDRGLKTF